MKFVFVQKKAEYKKYWKQLELNLLQSWEWGEIKQKDPFKPLRIAFFEKDDVVALISISIKTFFMGKIRYGIVERCNISNEYLKGVVNLLHENILPVQNLDFMLFEFNLHPGELDPEGTKLKRAGKTFQPQYTNVIDLSPTEDELFDVIRKKYKKHRNIKLAEKKGVKVWLEEGSEENIRKFYNLMSRVSENRKFIFHNRDYISKVVKTLIDANMGDIFFAYKDRHMIGTYFVAYDSVGAYELYGGVTLLGRNIFASYLLKWKAMLQAKGRGKKYYDQWGVAKLKSNGDFDKSHHLFRISKFKAAFGGNYVEFVDQLVLRKSKSKYMVYSVAIKLLKLRSAILEKFKYIF